MIPVRLALRNFMPYRDNVPPLVFTGIHTASIWGENGNGKSALIDAVTWALWGKTRARSDDDIIHLGQNETEVEFDFAVGEQVYRIIRKHARPKRQRGSGQSSLDLLIASNGEFKVISGNKIAETEDKIRDILRMDYETFVNSAFLRQGHADDFTVATPSKRKQVLTDILGLSRYDELEERARESARKQETDKAVAEMAIRDMERELEQRPACEAELARAQAELLETETALAAGESRLNGLRQQKELLESRQQQLAQIERHIAETGRNLARWQEQTRQHQARIGEYETLISRRADIEQGFAQLGEARKSIEELNRKLGLVSRLSQQKHNIEMAIQKAQAAIVTEHTLAGRKIADLEATSQRLPQLKADLQQAQTELNRLAGEEETLKQKREAEQQIRSLIHGLEADRARLGHEIDEIGGKLDLLAHQTSAVCPLCERELGEEDHRLIQDKYTDEKSKANSQESKLEGDVARAQAELKVASAEIPRLETRLNQANTSTRTRAGLLEREIDAANQGLKELDEWRTRLLEIEEKLARKDFAHAEHEALRQLDAELARLSYDPQQHEQVRQRLAGLEKWEGPSQKLGEADRLAGQEKEALANDEQAALEASRSLEADNQTKLALAAALSSLPQVAADLAAAETAHRSQAARQKQAQETVGTVKGRLQRFAEVEVMARDKEAGLRRAAEEEIIYRDLAEAFGKKGIQAWLIEMALPDIELEANRLLGRMTDNRMHVKFETQRQTKAGDTAETLEIKIADELGTRNYEMYSGGEAFRINFAIRIALSRLLARRAGAPLPTLIIDEGFGTQDATGIEKLKEAIISIQDDFKMILVITHVEEMRDAFPTRIDVTKTAEGSTLRIS